MNFLPEEGFLPYLEKKCIFCYLTVYSCLLNVLREISYFDFINLNFYYLNTEIFQITLGYYPVDHVLYERDLHYYVA